jgi:predicted nucleotidyltransferase
LVEFDAPLEIYIANRNAAIEYLQKTFGRAVDIANPNSLKPHFKERILKQAIYA